MKHAYLLKKQSQRWFNREETKDDIVIYKVEYDTNENNFATHIFGKVIHRLDNSIKATFKRKLSYNKYGKIFFTYENKKYEILSNNNFEIFESAKNNLIH